MHRMKVLVVLALVLGGTTVRMHMAARASTPEYVAIPKTCRGVTLKLQPGARMLDGRLDQGVSIPPGWPPMPLDPVDLPAPLYPKAIQSSTKASVAFHTRPASPYVKTAVAKFTIPTTVDAGLSWYAKAFASCGYQVTSHGTMNGNGSTAGGITFKSTTFPNVYVSVSLQQVSDSLSLLVYYGAAVSLPLRPQATYVPSSEKRVRITYDFPDGKHEWRLTIKKAEPLATLVGAINSGADWDSPKLPDYIRHTCFSPRNRGSARLDFVPSSGKQKVVFVDYSCRSFGIAGPGNRIADYNKVEDYDRSVWYAVGYVAYKYCESHKCKKFHV